jgi:hypothetical protein
MRYFSKSSNDFCALVSFRNVCWININFVFVADFTSWLECLLLAKETVLPVLEGAGKNNEGGTND